MGPKDDNPLGFWESEKISDFNDEIFHSAGSSWQDWGPLDPEVFVGPHSQHFHSAARWLLGSEFGGAERIVLKDPRICRLYPFWRAALIDSGYSPVVVSPIRAPNEVVASLVARNAMSPSRAMRLWLSHVVEAEVTSRLDPRHIMLWPDYMASWRQHVGQITALIGDSLLGSDMELKVDRFLDSDLRNQRSKESEENIPDIVDRTMIAMTHLANGFNTGSALRALDRVRRDLHIARQLYYDGPY
jgi:hypothetical protein